ncbi:MAG: hypothetical protein P4M11_09565 [Candidatus Pacebacteria bacterium]|nr:hypothetical protein [Candidatus Paceibacterota bacterium]
MSKLFSYVVSALRLCGRVAPAIDPYINLILVLLLAMELILKISHPVPAF